MHIATAVYKTGDDLTPAGFDITVTLDPDTNEPTSTDMSMMFDHIRNERCDGFVIDLGIEQKHIIRSDS